MLLLAATREWLRPVAWLGATLVGVRGWGQSAHSSQLAACSVQRTLLYTTVDSCIGIDGGVR